MRVVVSEFMSLDGVVQAPGGQEEDLDGGFAHGGWSMPFFDPEVMGSPTLVRALLAADLVDELNVMIEPVLLGGGKRIFTDDGIGRTLELVDVQVASTGVLVCSYRPTGEPISTGNSDELYVDPADPPVPPTEA